MAARIAAVVVKYGWLQSRSWEGQIFVYVISISAALMHALHLSKEGCIEVQYVLIVHCEWHDDDLLLGIVEVTDDRIVYKGALTE